MKKPQTRAEFIGYLNKELLSVGVADRSEILADFELHFDNSIALGQNEAEICNKLGDIAEIAAQYGDDYISPAVAVTKAELPKADSFKIPTAPSIPVVTVEAAESPLVLDTFTEVEEIIAAAPVHPEAVIRPAPAAAEQPAPAAAEQPAPAAAEQPAPVAAEQPAPAAAQTPRLYNFNIPNFNPGGLIKVLLIDVFILSWVLTTIFSILVSELAIAASLIMTGITIIIGDALPNFFSPFSPISTILLGIAVLALGGLGILLGIKLIFLCIKIMRGVVNWHSMTVVGRKVFPRFAKGKEEEA